MKKYLIASVIVVVALALGLATTGAQLPFTGKAIADPVRVGHLPIAQVLPLFTAVERGYFKDEGLDVELVRMDDPKLVIDLTATGKLDAAGIGAAAGIAALAEQKQPGALKAYGLVCTGEGRANDEILVSVKSNITSLADLRGRRIGIVPGVQFRTHLYKILTGNELTLDDVEPIDLPVSVQLGALEAGQVDALLTLEPVGTIGQAKNISRVLIANPGNEFIAEPWCNGIGLVSGRFLKERPGGAAAFVRAMRRAMAEVGSNSSTRMHLVEYLGMDEATAAGVPLPDFVSTKGLDPDTEAAYQAFADAFYEYNATATRPNVSAMILRD